MESSVKQRIKEFIEYKRISTREFERLCGLANGYVRSINKSILPDRLKSISLQFPELNIGWIATGEGEMLRKVVPQKGEAEVEECRGVPFFDAEAAACGALSGFGSPLAADRAAAYISLPQIPQQEGDFFISARGRSMLDVADPSHSIPDGAMVMCRPKSGSFIEWGEIYCVATREGYVIKKLMPSDDDAYIRCVSTNEAEFPPYEIPKAEIVGIGRVIAVVSVLRL